MIPGSFRPRLTEETLPDTLWERDAQPYWFLKSLNLTEKEVEAVVSLMATTSALVVWNLACDKNLDSMGNQCPIYDKDRLRDLYLAGVAVKYPYTDGWYDRSRAESCLRKMLEMSEEEYIQHISTQKVKLFRISLAEFSRKMDVLHIPYTAGETEDANVWLNITLPKE